MFDIESSLFLEKLENNPRAEIDSFRFSSCSHHRESLIVKGGGFAI